MNGKQHTDRRHTENTRSDITQTKQRHKAHRKKRTHGWNIYKKTDGHTEFTHARTAHRKQARMAHIYVSPIMFD